MKVIAHRGHSRLYGDNNIESFKKAIECGEFDILEMDIQVNNRGVIVVNHDLILDYTKDYLTLQEVLDSIEIPSKMRVYLDLKGPVGIVRALEQFFIDNYQFDITQFIVCSFNINYLRLFKLPFEFGFITSNCFDTYTLRKLLDDRITYFVIEWSVLSPLTILWCKDRGIQVFAYTPDTDDQVNYALRLDLDGIVLNSPMSSFKLE